MIQQTFLDTITDQTPLFHGPDLQPADIVRLTSLLARVRDVMLDGQWHTLAELAARCGGTEASCSARLRDLRKPENGSHTVTRSRVDGGLFTYRLEQ